MINRSVFNLNNSPEPPLALPGASSEPEHLKNTSLAEPLYQPYPKKPALPGPPYEPYKDI
jgi:hypothetical protein